MEYDNYGIDETGFRGIEGTYHHKDYLGVKFMKSGFMKEWVDEYLGDNIKTILDIGALEGGDTLRFSSWYPDASVFSIEGSPNNFEVIKKKLNNRKNVKIFNYVITENTGLVTFYGKKYKDFEHDGDMIMGSIYQYIDSLGYDYFSNTEPILMNSISFDDFCEINNINEIDVCHIDIEGATYNLVLGMNKVLPKLIYTEQEAIEYFKDKKLGGNDNLFQLLESKGYELVKNLGNDFLFKLKN
jgi:FkbM family methyltransferase